MSYIVSTAKPDIWRAYRCETPGGVIAKLKELREEGRTDFAIKDDKGKVFTEDQMVELAKAKK